MLSTHSYYRIGYICKNRILKEKLLKIIIFNNINIIFEIFSGPCFTRLGVRRKIWQEKRSSPLFFTGKIYTSKLFRGPWNCSAHRAEISLGGSSRTQVGFLLWKTAEVFTADHYPSLPYTWKSFGFHAEVNDAFSMAVEMSMCIPGLVRLFPSTSIVLDRSKDRQNGLYHFTTNTTKGPSINIVTLISTVFDPLFPVTNGHKSRTTP